MRIKNFWFIIFGFVLTFSGFVTYYYLASRDINLSVNNTLTSGQTNGNVDVLQKSDFSLENAPSESAKGKIVLVSGDVEWQSRVSTESSKIVTPIMLQQGETLITKESGLVNFEFGENISIQMFEDTTLDIIQTLPINYVFSQKKGNAIYSNLSESSVNIRTGYLIVEVSGEVEVSRNTKENTVELNVVEGKSIIYYNDKNYKVHVYELSAGEGGVFSEDTRQWVQK